MKYTGIPLLTRRQAIAGKYEKSAITIKGIEFIRNTINDESNTTRMNKKRINRAVKAKNYKRVRIKAILDGFSCGYRTANVEKSSQRLVQTAQIQTHKTEGELRRTIASALVR